jgi:two-component system, chemotaxis family, chemotaxis protein CheY
MWRILVVDDNFTNRKLLLDILEGVAKCDIAVNGREAIDAFNHSLQTDDPYDLILLDIAMPEINGLEVLQIVRESEKKVGIQLGDGIPIIMVTAYKQPFIEAFDRGCDDYIIKPIDPDELIKKIQEKIGDPEKK